MRKNRYRLISLFLCMALSVPVYAQGGATYSLQKKPVANAVQENGAVVEFFSFYCPSCYAFSQGYGIDKAIRDALPAGGKMSKYHTGFLGPLGDELTRAWSVAIVAGIEEQIEPLLFDAGQKTQTLKSAEDIRVVFMKAGMSAVEYDRMLVSQKVIDMTEKQKRLFKEYDVTGTPSVYVNGRYRIENSAFHADSVEDFRENYVVAVKSLLDMADK